MKYISISLTYITPKSSQRIKLVYAVLVLTALVYTERRLIEPRLTGARLSALVQAALVYKVLVYQEWIRLTSPFAGYQNLGDEIRLFYPRQAVHS